MIKPIFKVIQLGVYPFDVLFTIGTTEDQVMKYLEKKCNYRLDSEEKGFLRFTGKSGRTVRFKGNQLLCWSRNPHIPIIAHEIFHVAELVMEKINAPLNEQTSEPYAYLIEHIWREALPLIKK